MCGKTSTHKLVYLCDTVVLLTKCMDVEKNPGPDENFVTLMQNVD